jgi:glycosyltransferase involved in cell wall biosynthesis
VVLQQNSLPDYRQEVLRLLADGVDGHLSALVGKEAFDETVKSGVELDGIVTGVENHYMLGRRVLWQSGVVNTALSADCAIVQLNPRILSTWVILVVRKCLLRPTVLWGHVWSRSGPRSRTNRLRDLMRALADTQVVYTERQRLELVAHRPSSRVVVAPNAIYPSAEMSGSTRQLVTDILYVGRLVGAKKPQLLLDAFLLAAEVGLPETCRLVFLGEGPIGGVMRARLESEVRFCSRVRFVGHVSPFEVKPFYERALVSASPGYVGLSATQSFSFGVPVLVARDEPHSPEVEGLRAGFNAVWVPSDDVRAMADALIQVFRERDAWLERRAAIAADCKERYSVEQMAIRLVAAVEETR